MIISIINQKGGTGKTTTTVNLGRALAQKGCKVLLIDMDPQGNLSYSLAINQFEYSIRDVLVNSVDYTETLVERELMHVIPTNMELAQFELNGYDGKFLLKEALESSDGYDYVLIDCPPSLSQLTINALNASDKVLVPIQLDVFSIQGLRQIMNTVNRIKTEYNSQLQVIGVLPVMVDSRKKLTNEVLEHVKMEFEVYVFKNHIRTNVKAAEAPSFGTSVIEYAPDSNSARDYLAAAEELMNL